MQILLEISTPLGCSVILDLVCYGVTVKFHGFIFLADLVVFVMLEFNFIIGMD